MMILASARRRGLCVAVELIAFAVLLGGCQPAAEKEPVTQPKAEEPVADVVKPAMKQPEEPKAVEPPTTEAKKEEATPKETPTTEQAAETPQEEKWMREEAEMAEKPRPLGPPLVDHPGNLKRLDSVQPVWIDPVGRQIVLQGETCRAGYPLEFFATYSNRSYESVVAVNVKPSIVHAGLLALGAEAGHPAQVERVPAPEDGEDVKIIPASGTEVAIEVRWKDAKGKVQSCPAQHWVRNIKTGKELDSNWVFAGSMFVTDEATGRRYYQADSGELICVLSLPTAMLDLPIRSYGAIEARSFEAFEEHMPPEHTPVTLLLKPVVREKAPAASGQHAAAEAAAVEAAEAWLQLADRGEYSQCWEDAAAYLKHSVDRRDFVKQFSDAQKPLGKIILRRLESKQFVTSLPGAPSGQYVVLKYHTSFEKRDSATETMTLMLDHDKKWRVSGYFVK